MTLSALQNVHAAAHEKRDATSRSLVTYCKARSEWLTESIQTCKRKILEGTGHEVSKAKRPRLSLYEEKENAAVDSENCAMSVVEEPEKPVVIAKQKVAVSASKRPVPVQTAVKKTAKVGKTAPVQNHVTHSSEKDIPTYLSVMALRVADLKKELRQRGLDANGLKKDLQKRLLEEIYGKEEPSLDKSKEAPEPATTKHETVSSKVESSDTNYGDTDVEMKDANSDSDMTFGDQQSNAPGTNASNAVSCTAPPTGTKSDSSLDQKKSSESPAKEEVVSKSLLRSTAGLFSPSNIASKLQSLTTSQQKSPPKPTSALQDTTPAKSAAQSKKAPPSSGKPKPAPPSRLIPSETKQVVPGGKTTSEESTARQRQADTSKVLTKPSMAMSIPSIKNSVPSSAGALTKAKRDKCKEDRSARLAEIRGKSKPVVGSKPAGGLGELPILSASKLLKHGPAKDSKSERKLVLAAQMREKAAAGLKTTIPSNVSSTTKANFPQKQQAAASKPQTSSTASSATKATFGKQRIAPLTSGMKSVPVITSSSKVVATQPMTAKPSTQVSSTVSKAASKALSPKSTGKHHSKKPVPKPDILSPMSTYSISDREQSDTDDDSDSEHDRTRPKKKLPTWAKRDNLLPALERQYASTTGGLDPETIFPPVHTCNLDEIFDQKKSKFKKRSSSANWTKDGVTHHEIVAYKRTMGY